MDAYTIMSMIKKLLSLPPNLVANFHELTGFNTDEWLCGHDPIGQRLGSGGGTAWLLKGAGSRFAGSSLIIHAGGQSRRLPAYAPSGKVLTPIPVYRWERGQRLSQTLLDLQVPFYESIIKAMPSHLRTTVVSGDVLIRGSVPNIPTNALSDVDVVCFGLWLDASTAKNHGVFVMQGDQLKCMLQKPSVETLNALQKDHLYMTDIGVWMLSDRALDILMKRCERGYYDLYTDFGGAMGHEPLLDDPDIAALRIAILPLENGEFYHFGTTRELITSALRLQNLITDQRQILHHSRKPHPAMFVQNAVTIVKLTEENHDLWIENSCVGAHWTLTHDHAITGVPRNDWNVSLQPGQCVDIVPIGEKDYAVRVYNIDERFDGDEQFHKRFPVVHDNDEMLLMVNHLLGNAPCNELYDRCQKMSADDITNNANLQRLFFQRENYRKENWGRLAENYRHSVFYQLDLDDAANEFRKQKVDLPLPLPAETSLMTRIHDAMFRSVVLAPNGKNEETHAFSLLREGILSTANTVSTSSRQATLSVCHDQIVWGRSPVRIDIAGGWTDTPPYCLLEGGNVVNLAIELNHQPPLQCYVKPCSEQHVILRSIDLGATEIISTYDELAQFNKVGSPFSIPKAALALAGFLPQFSPKSYPTLQKQLEVFGAGIEVTLLSAIPAGSGLGTSSILAATVLGTLSDFCGLAWDMQEIGRRTLILEQLLTTGGGWQDQYGGILSGVKLLQTSSGFSQNPVVRWLPTHVFTAPEYEPCHLLYYTGITRTAKTILADIVRRMFLNQHEQLLLLREMKQHALDMYDAIQCGHFETTGTLIRKTWEQNQMLDSGTNPSEVRALTELIDDLCFGYKLPGAGGGGYLYMVAKDPEAARRIRQILEQNPLRPNARFVDMSLSMQGLQISRS